MKKAAASKSDPKSEIAKPAKGKTTPAGLVKAAGKAVRSAAGKLGEKAGVKPAKSPLKVAVKKTESKTGALPATIVVRHDAGWGNTLHLRGEGAGLSWHCGTPLCSVGADEWVWVAPASGKITFKVLHNDRAWAHGENFTVSPGETVTVTPVF